MLHAREPEGKHVGGFRHQVKVYKLVFDDPDLEGLVVKARSLSVREMDKFSNLRDTDDREEAAQQTEELLDGFARAVKEWNLEDEEGNPLPITGQALGDYPDAGFVMTMVDAWITAVTGVDDELGKDSPSGRRSLEEAIPMEPLSPSQAS